MMNIFNGENPLWLPPGSVRAVVLVAICTTAIYLAITGFLDPTYFMNIVMIVFGYYFGKAEKVDDKVNGLLEELRKR